MGSDWKNVKGQASTTGSGSKLPSRKQFMESTSLSESRSTEASTAVSLDDLVVDSAFVPSTSRAVEVSFNLLAVAAPLFAEF